MIFFFWSLAEPILLIVSECASCLSSFISRIADLHLVIRGGFLIFNSESKKLRAAKRSLLVHDFLETYPRYMAVCFILVEKTQWHPEKKKGIFNGINLIRIRPHAPLEIQIQYWNILMWKSMAIFFSLVILDNRLFDSINDKFWNDHTNLIDFTSRMP